MSVRLSATNLGAATVLGHGSQLLWIGAGSRVMSPSTFGAVLVAQALYGVLQMVVDNGPATVGARLAARGELGPAQVGELVRFRLTVAICVAPAALGLGAAGVGGSLATTAPFVLALLLFAVFNVWEPYGRGQARPLAAYMFARSAVPAAVVLGMLAAGGTFPGALAGVLECVVLVALAVLFRQHPIEELRLAVRAGRGPWRSITSVGVPTVIFQASVASGALILSGFGNRIAAGIFASCVRLLTGLNAVNGVVTAALFPRLARSRQDTGAADQQVVAFGLRLIAVISTAACAASLFLGDAIASVLIEHSTSTTAEALILTTAAAAAMGNVPMYSYLLIAGEHERDLLLPFGAGAVVTIGSGIATIAIGGTSIHLVATALLAGQLVIMGALALRLRSRMPMLKREVFRATGLAVLLPAIAAMGLIDGLTLAAGTVLLAIAAALASTVISALGAFNRQA